MRAPISAALAMAAFFPLLAACSSSSDKQGAPPCPRVSVLSDASRMTRFKPGPGRDITDVELQAEIASYTGSCTYDMDKLTMNLSIQVGIDAERGPAAGERKTGLAYFVAIPVFFPKPEAKQIMPVEIAFPADMNRIRFVDEEVTISFPMRDFKDLKSYEIFLGLQLDQSQLEYNRATKRSR